MRAGLACLAVCLVLAVTAPANIVVSDDQVTTAARATLARIEDAFIASDHRALGDLVHPDGVRLGIGPEAERISELTPAQAFYYFKSLFAGGSTEQFEFLRQRTAHGERVLAVATWRRMRDERGGPDMSRLLITISRHEDGWRITEMTSLRGG